MEKICEKRQFVNNCDSKKPSSDVANLTHTKRKILDEFPHISVKILSIVTTGDKLKGKLTEFGGKGLFVKELQRGALDKRADIAVHSMKDVPNVLPNSTQIIAMFKREDPRDVLVTIHGKALNELPLNSIVGTSSLRRKNPDVRTKTRFKGCRSSRECRY